MPGWQRRNIKRARELRNNATPAECRLWLHLQNRKLEGYKFTRQREVRHAYGDFICRSHRLIVELDGESHDFTGASDEIRTERLERLGHEVIRFTNKEVFENLDGVLAAIAQTLRAMPTPALRACPSRKREGS